MGWEKAQAKNLPNQKLLVELHDHPTRRPWFHLHKSSDLE